MAYRVRAVRDLDEYGAAVGAIGHYFGWEPEPDEVERFARVMGPERMHAAFDGAEIVAGAGVCPLELTVPGDVLPCAGVTAVGVLPTHRRRGLLTRLMRAQLADVRERGEPLAALWASEETIYGRYGYGLATLQLELNVDVKRVGLRDGLPGREGSMRLVDEDEALRVFPRIYERLRRSSVGFVSRSRDWWEIRRLDDTPGNRFGGGPLNRVLFEVDGRPVGFAAYRIVQRQERGETKRTLRAREAFGVDPRATREVWRFLLQVDWVDELDARFLPFDHPLLQLVARVSLLQTRIKDGLWLRLVDVGAALDARSYATDGRVTLELAADPLFPDNGGTWTIEPGRVRKTTRRPDLRLDTQTLAAAYLGGISFTQLADAERVDELTRGGVRRADALFRTERQPWCPEGF